MSAQPSLGGCEQMGAGIIVCYQPRNIVRRVVHKCWTCERRTPFVQTWDGARYGVTDYCTVCLDYWQDGYRAPRPFARYWKRDRAAEIREMWDNAMLPDQWQAWTRWDMHRATCDEGEECAECETRPS